MTTLYFRTSYKKNAHYFLRAIESDYDVHSSYEQGGRLTVKCTPKTANAPRWGYRPSGTKW